MASIETKSFVNKAIYTNQGIDIISQKKVQSESIQEYQIYSFGSLPPSPSKRSLYIKVGMEVFVSVVVYNVLRFLSTS